MTKKKPVRARARQSKKSDANKTQVHSENTTDISETAEIVTGKSRGGKANPPLNEAKLRSLFLLLLQGKTQTECARHFDVTDRTIRNWIKHLDDIPPDILRVLNPEKEMVRALYRFTAREIELLRWKNDAEKDGDTRAKFVCNKQLRDLESERLAFLEKIGLFANFRPQFNIDKDPAAEEADYIAEITAGLLQFHDLELDKNNPEKEA